MIEGAIGYPTSIAGVVRKQLFMSRYLSFPRLIFQLQDAGLRMVRGKDKDVVPVVNAYLASSSYLTHVPCIVQANLKVKI